MGGEGGGERGMRMREAKAYGGMPLLNDPSSVIYRGDEKEG
jgi:hypothetical protein